MLLPALLVALLALVSTPGLVTGPASGSTPLNSEPHIAGGTSTDPNQTSRWIPVNETAPSAPPTGGGYAMAYDPALSAVVAFGEGQSPGVIQNSTWEFANGS